MNKTQEILDYITDNKINISTHTMYGKILNPDKNLLINTMRFAKNMEMSKTGIVGKKYIVKKIIKVKEGNKYIKKEIKKVIVENIVTIPHKKKPSKKAFNNCVSVYVYVGKIQNSTLSKYVNVKICQNGSIQMTGPRNIQDCKTAVDILIKELSKKVYVKQNGKKVLRGYVSDKSQLGLYSMKIALINTEFDFKQCIDINRLLKHLKYEQKYLPPELKDLYYKYDPTSHDSIDIYYPYSPNDISIFVFATGKVIVTGGTTYESIVIAHKYISGIINKYSNDIIISKNNLTNINSIMNEYNKLKNDLKKKKKVYVSN